MQIEAWRVHDTGLVAAPGPFRRLGGSVRHHRGRGAPWPDRVRIELLADDLVVTAPDGSVVAAWPRSDVVLRKVSAGPPVSFVVEVPGAAHLLAAASGPAVDDLLAAFVPHRP